MLIYEGTRPFRIVAVKMGKTGITEPVPYWMLEDLGGASIFHNKGKLDISFSDKTVIVMPVGHYLAWNVYGSGRKAKVGPYPITKKELDTSYTFIEEASDAEP